MIVSGLRRSLPEYSVLRLAAAQLGVKVVAVAEREGGGIDIERVRRSMKSGNGLEGFQFAKGVFLDGGCDNVTDAVRGLVGREIGRDGAGLRGVLRVRGGGRLDCWQFPALQHVVQTGHEGIEGSVTFRSALVYSGEEAGGDGGADYVRRAEEVGARNRLCANHEVREGKVVVMPCLEGHFLHSALAAVLKGALWVHPGQRDGRSVSQHEGALLL